MCPPPLVEIGLADLPKSVGETGPPGPPACDGPVFLLFGNVSISYRTPKYLRLEKIRILMTKCIKLCANVIFERTLICSSFLASISSFSCRLSIAALVSLRTLFNWSLAFSLVSVRLLILISASTSFSIWSLRSAKRLALKKLKRKYIEKSKI